MQESQDKTVRRWRRLRRWILGEAKRDRRIDDDPDVLLRHAEEEMRVQHAKNRERAVQAITQKNQLQAMVDDTQRRVDRLQEKIRSAHEAGDEALMSQLIQEKQSYERTLAEMQPRLEKAIQTTEMVKSAIKRQDEIIRRKTAETLALRTQWRLIQVEQALTISLAQISAGNHGPVTRFQLQERHRRNRELVVEAITQKNVLQSIVAKAREQSAAARESAKTARDAGDEDLERDLLRDMEQNEASLASTDAALRQAIQLSDRARTLLEEESAHFKRLHLDEGATRFYEEDDAPSERDVARYRASLRRVIALAFLLALIALVLSLIWT